MRITWALAAALAVGSASREADGPPKPPADFKLQVASFGAGKEPVYTEEVVYRRGRVYVFPSETTEVVVIEPSASTVDIISVARRVQAEVTFANLDEALGKIRASTAETVAELEKKGGKAGTVEARIQRQLAAPKLEVAHDPKSNRVRLTCPIVEVDAGVEPEAQADVDAGRLALVAVSLSTIAKLGAFRTPDDLPPFVELETIAALTGERKLRPVELTYIYRIAGPPLKIRRTYRLVPSLTDREVEAVSRVDRLREVATILRYDQYRRPK